MAGAKQNRVYEITDATSLAKLSGVQVAVTQLETMAVDVIKAIPEKRGVVGACATLAARVLQECEANAQLVKADKMEAAEAKVRNDQTQKIVKIIQEIGGLNAADIKAMEAEAAGHKKAADALAVKYDQMATKYERDERIDNEDEDSREPEPPKPPTKKAPAKKPKGKRAPKGKGKKT